MASATYFTNKLIFYEVSVETVIRGHHVYKARWTLTMNDKLFGKEMENINAKDTTSFEVEERGLFKWAAY